MHFYCTCGNRISDTTDFLSYKAYLLADQDEQDYYDAIEQEVKNEEISREECVDNIMFSFGRKYLGKAMYQCLECGRLFIEDETGRNFYTFVPEGDVNKRILNSVEGEKWKGYLRGEWEDEKADWQEHNGYIWIEVNKSFEPMYFNDKEEFQKQYYLLFEQLKKEGIIRSAVMKVNKEWGHDWSL